MVLSSLKCLISQRGINIMSSPKGIATYKCVYPDPARPDISYVSLTRVSATVNALSCFFRFSVTLLRWLCDVCNVSLRTSVSHLEKTPNSMRLSECTINGSVWFLLHSYHLLRWVQFSLHPNHALSFVTSRSLIGLLRCGIAEQNIEKDRRHCGKMIFCFSFRWQFCRNICSTRVRHFDSNWNVFLSSGVC